MCTVRKPTKTEMKIYFIFIQLGLITISQCMAPIPDNQNITKSGKVAAADYRLNELTKPLHYDIEITPYLNESPPNGKIQFTFDGVTEIQIKPSTNTDVVRLNAKRLNIKKITIKKFVNPPIEEITVSEEHLTDVEILVLTFSKTLTADEIYVLKFEYDGHMDTDMRGFYRSSYVQNGKVEWLGATQLETTNARRVFPCFDEPSYKATFKLTLHVSSEYSAVISNTKHEEPVSSENNVNTYIFKVTPIMSTYLLAFVISKFEKRSDTNNKLSVFSRPDQIKLTEYPLEFGIESLKYLDDFLGIKFQEMTAMEKMDMVAIPDFASGAMENWGLLTYKELYLLYDEQFSTDLDKREIALTVAHEQAHQWFGNLVTCDWWSNTWLNEGFATYFEFFVTAAIEPQWQLENTFITDTVHRALLFDSQDSTHALSHPDVNTPDESSAMFSLISYQKGGSIIRMIEHLIGTENFKLALRAYLAKYKYEVAKPEDLLTHFQDAVNNDKIDVAEIFMPWITQPGYPVITVTMDQQRKVAEISQTRFFLNKKETIDNSKWSIPLTYTTEKFDNLKPTHILQSTDESYEITVDAPNWIIFNVQQSGFYRVKYDTNSWNFIESALKSTDHGGIHELNRAQIVDDLLNFARSTDSYSYDYVLGILHYLKKERNYLPWHAAFTSFAFLTSRMTSSQLDLFRSHVLELTTDAHKHLGFNSRTADTQLDIHLRGKLIEWSCKSRNFDCATTAFSLLNSYLENETEERIPVDIREQVICAGLHLKGDTAEDTYKTIWEIYKNQPIASEQIILLKGLGCAKQEEVLHEHLNNIFSQHVRKQDKRTAFQATYTRYEENLQIVLNYLIKNHINVADALEDKSAFIGYLTGLADRFTLKSQIDQLEKFQVDMAGVYGEFKSSFESAIARATSNLEWNEKNIPIITKFIEEHQGNGGVIMNSINLFGLLFAVVLQFIF